MAKIIRADGTDEEVFPEDGKVFDLDEIQAIVGGFIELAWTKNGMMMWINEERKLSGLPVNERATELYKNNRYDDIVGDVLIGDEKEFVDKRDEDA